MRRKGGEGKAALLLPVVLFLAGALGCLAGMEQILPALDQGAHFLAQLAGWGEEAPERDVVSEGDSPALSASSSHFALQVQGAGDSLIQDPQPVEEQEDIPVPENPVEVLEEQFATSGRGDMYIQAGKGYIRNTTTTLTRSQVQSEVGKLPDIQITDTDQPQVLIIHTHATESYEPYDVGYADRDYSARSTDNEQNVVAVGAQIARQLEAAGIGVIHDTTQHDNPSYNGSYDRSLETVESYLEQYPTIQVVLDIHRDAIERDGGVRVKPTVKIDGKKAAQVMICVGCGSDSAQVPEYRQNLRFGAMLQNQLQTDYPGLARPLYLCNRNYNLHLTKGSLLIEMGGHANTLEEALYSGEMVGKAVARVLEKLK